MNRICVVAIMLAAFLLSARPARAEVNITIPFAFSVGQKNLPAGTYGVSKTGSAYNLLQLCHREGKGSTITAINSVQSSLEAASNSDKLVFHRYGNRYFLAQFWTRGSSVGFELPASKAEREIANGAAKSKTEVLRASK